MLEVQLNEKVPKAVVMAFGVCTTLLVAVHLLALMIFMCILPQLEVVCNVPNLVKESTDQRLHWYVETAWALSTLLGLPLFLIEVAIISWVRLIITKFLLFRFNFSS